ncbi:transposable element Tcb1 transposase [Trichonephila clavipes]|nr:transposable element Tcb1 transposase [Trichonephila clavipes]
MNSITERRVIHQVKIDPKISALKIAASTSNTLGRSVSAETVRRVLRKAGYNGRVARKNPLIAMRVSSTSSAVTVIVWCSVNQIPHTTQNTIPTVKHGGGSVMQDNDPKHTAFAVKEWLFYHCRNQLNTPPQLLTLNVIENLWSHLERTVQKHQITSREQLKSVLQEEWLNIAPETTRHLMESMPWRLEAVISAKDDMNAVDILIHENPPTWAVVKPANLGAETQRQTTYTTRPAQTKQK